MMHYALSKQKKENQYNNYKTMLNKIINNNNFTSMIT
jgi:hypothetical protein